MKIILKAFFLITLIFGISHTGLAMEKIVIEGTGDSQVLLRVLADAFHKRHPNTMIEVPESIGSGGGIRSVVDGKCALGRTARELNDKEKKYNLNYKVFAHSPVVFVANLTQKGPDNLSTKQIIDIFSGNITSWGDLGGEKEKIYVVNREEGDSSKNILDKTIPGFKDIKTPAGKTVYSSPETIEILKHYKNTIGYGALSMAINTGLAILKVDGIYPTIKNVQSGSYKLVEPFGLVWKGELIGLAKDFVSFLFTKEAQDIMIDNGTVPTNTE
ncbi:MAG: substrate-binding domain-containing protein [Nitrospirae bacterium]|nr:substrate-binding domain-containing protein [Nitrospirota bacterium]